MAGDGSSEGFRLQDYRPKEDTDGEESRRLQVDGEDGGEQQEPEPETLSELRHDSASVSSSSATMAGGFVTPVSAAVQAVAELMENSTEQLPGSARSKLQNQEKVAVSDQKISVNAALPFVSKMQNELQSSGCPPSPRNLSPTSVTQSNLAATLSEQRLRVVPVDGDFLPEAEHIVSSDQRIASTVPGGKSPSADGYNWRKYGQKQVKIPKGHRSYYRCTSSDCHAKKIECCNHAGSIVEVVYKDTHNHEVPNRASMNRASKPTSVRNSITDRPITMLNNTELSTPSKDTRLEASSIPERKRQFASGSDETTEVNVDEPEPKRRLKHCSSAYSCSALKPGKKPKFVIRAAGDVGNSSDGYRWRKYGQKMVKGNPHPRNYYKCTSAGCPVRKHIERAVDNPSALIITYKGLHDHDTPVPKNQQAPPSPNLVLAVAPVSAFQNQKPPVDKGETVTQELDLGGGEKAIDSARTFLSIGFEIKPC